MLSRTAAKSLRVASVGRRAVRPAQVTAAVAAARAAVAPAARAALHYRAGASAEEAMLCMQCEQTDKGTGCTVVGVCGKTPQTAGLQDVLVHAAKGVAVWAALARQADPSAVSARCDHFVFDAMFETMTNVSFDPVEVAARIAEGKACLAEARALFEAANKDGAVAPPAEGSAAYFALADSLEALEAQAGEGDVSVRNRLTRLGEDLGGVNEMALYGLKGAAAYYHHACLLGGEDPQVTADLIQAAADCANPNPTLEETLGLCLRLGEVNVRVMAALDARHTEKFGKPEPTEVSCVPAEGKAILVSGHDIADLHEILVATEGTGINVYTHGELMPAHGYPELKKFPHLKGNYGSAWQMQKTEFAAFPGSIVLTSNCIIEPRKSYRDRIFTRRVVSMPGVRKLADGEWGPLIEAAQAAPGFTAADVAKYVPPKGAKTSFVGFGHHAVLGMAGDVINAIDTGVIGGLLVTGGCDGTESDRSYFTDLAKAVPENFLVASVGCGAFRVADIGRADVAGVPGGTLRVGQCNDSYGAALIALALADHYKTDINGLPITFAISWLEQKAVAVLLSLLHLGVRDIYLGPRLPAFVSPAALQILVDTFAIHPISTVEQDLPVMLERIGAKQ